MSHSSLPTDLHWSLCFCHITTLYTYTSVRIAIRLCHLTIQYICDIALFHIQFYSVIFFNYKSADSITGFTLTFLGSVEESWVEEGRVQHQTAAEVVEEEGDFLLCPLKKKMKRYSKFQVDLLSTFIFLMICVRGFSRAVKMKFA